MNIQIEAQKFYDHSLFIRGYSKETIRRYRTVINLFCKQAQITDIEEITEKRVRDFFYTGRAEKGWRVNSFITFRLSLSVFLQWCIHEKYLEKDFTKEVEVPKIEKRLPSRLTKQDALKLLETVYNYPYDNKFLRCRNHAIFSTFIFAGLRKKELLNLRYADMDLQNMSIFVNRGKGAKDRIIPMSYTLCQSLTRYLEERKRAGKTCSAFFASLKLDVGFTDSGMKRLVNKMKKASKIPFTVHKLRHSFATLMLEGGCDIYSLSKMMGHSDIKTTTIYLAASAEHLRSQMTKHPLNDLVLSR